MKHIALFLAFVAIYSNTSAQSTLTIANSKPVIGEVFYNHFCDTAGVSVSKTGAGVTWDYSALIETTKYTTTVISCTSTPYCDSFPSSDFAEVRMPDSAYSFCTADALGITEIGGHSSIVSGVGYEYYPKPGNFLKFPSTYPFTWLDTSIYTYYTPFASSRIMNAHNNIVDGYGTLITPTGKTTNALRIHTIRYITDSNYTSLPMTVFHHRLDYYTWYIPDFHSPVLAISTDNDPITGAIKYISSVQYSDGPSLSALFIPREVMSTIEIYPNPAQKTLYISDNGGSLQLSQISLIDISGREVYSIRNETNTKIELPTTSIANGMYLLKIVNSKGSIVRKIEINN